MKKILLFLSVMLLVFGTFGVANSMPISTSFDTFVDLGGGLIYDTGNDLTWLKDAGNFASSLYSANDFVDNLVIDGCENWRLPTLSELGSIPAVGYIGPDAVYTPFVNISGKYYWSTTEVGVNNNWDVPSDWVFGYSYSGAIHSGTDYANPDGSGSFFGTLPGVWGVWPVCDGNPVPEPATMLLLGSGLVGFAVIGRKRFKK